MLRVVTGPLQVWTVRLWRELQLKHYNNISKYHRGGACVSPAVQPYYIQYKLLPGCN
jgi:hypothetical protein